MRLYWFVDRKTNAFAVALASALDEVRISMIYEYPYWYLWNWVIASQMLTYTSTYAVDCINNAGSEIKLITSN